MSGQLPAQLMSLPKYHHHRKFTTQPHTSVNEQQFKLALAVKMQPDKDAICPDNCVVIPLASSTASVVKLLTAFALPSVNTVHTVSPTKMAHHHSVPSITQRAGV